MKNSTLKGRDWLSVLSILLTQAVLRCVRLLRQDHDMETACLAYVVLRVLTWKSSFTLPHSTLVPTVPHVTYFLQPSIGMAVDGKGRHIGFLASLICHFRCATKHISSQ